MTTPNILLTRIDNRLVHGQVGVTWANSLSANLLLVANDQAASDPVQQSLMDMVVSPGVETRYFTRQKTIDVIHRAASAHFHRLQNAAGRTDFGARRRADKRGQCRQHAFCRRQTADS